MTSQQFYSDFANKFKSSPALLEREKIALSLIDGQDVLDVGCGEGKKAAFLAGRNLSGVDIAAENINKAKEKGYKEVVCGDLNDQALPFPDESFDSVICFEVIEHLFDPIHALSEINRVLKPAGSVIISIPNIGWLAPRLALLLGIFSDFHDFQLLPCHIRFFTVARFKHLLTKTGFDSPKVYGTTDFVSKIPSQKILNYLAKMRPSLFSSNPVFFAKKTGPAELTKYSYEQISGWRSALRKLFQFR